MKSTVKRLLRRAGWDLRRYLPTTSPDAQLELTLRAFGIDLILDVGANEGQYAKSLRQLGFAGRIVSFEPLAAAHAALTAAAALDAAWSVADRAAIGAADGEITINIAGNSASSSVLPMLGTHRDAAPESAYVGQEQVPLRRLDGVVGGLVATSVMLKIDTQGYEAAVLAGAPDTLARAAVVQIELSLTPLYDGQALFDTIIGDLAAAGFELWAVWPGFARGRDGRLLQMDGIFARPERAVG